MNNLSKLSMSAKNKQKIVGCIMEDFVHLLQTGMKASSSTEISCVLTSQEAGLVQEDH